VSRSVAAKRVTVLPDAEGGTSEHAVETSRQLQAALNDAQAVELAQIGRRIEAHFGRPQDIEWCLADDSFAIVQSRPITTLFPIPEAADDEPHVYVSVGHQQMMTDAMKPLGLSMWQHTTPRPMGEAGGRLFVDVARLLASPTGRAAIIAGFTKSDPLIGDARGVGLIGAVELVRDKATKQSFDPKAGVAAYLVRRAQHHGAILRNMPGDIVAFCPPLIISEAEIDEMMTCFGKALDDTWAMVRERALV